MRRILLIAALTLSGSALAQSPVYDPRQLPEFHGKVEAYKLTPRDELDGFFLEDGLEIHVSTRLSSELARTVQPGDTVTIHGVRSADGQMVQAFSVDNNANGLKVSDVVTAEPPPTGFRPQPTRFIEARGRIKRQLHGVEGEFIGVLLDDGTNIRLVQQGMTPQNTNCLQPGHEIVVSGTGVVGALGKVVETRSMSSVSPVPGKPAEMQQCSVIPAIPEGAAMPNCRC